MRVCARRQRRDQRKRARRNCSEPRRLWRCLSDRTQTPEAPMTAEHALEVQTVFRGVVIGTKYVLAPSRHRPVRSRRHARRCTFAIGSSVHADAPVAPTFLRHLADDPRGVIHPLITSAALDGDGAPAVQDAVDDGVDAPYMITLAPGMSGAIYDGPRTRALRTESDG